MTDAPFKLPLQKADGWCEIADADGRLVADLAADNANLLTRQRDYIIAAVNAHAYLVRERDELRETLKRLGAWEIASAAGRATVELHDMECPRAKSRDVPLESCTCEPTPSGYIP